MYINSHAVGILAIIIGFTGYAPYLWNMFRGKTKPHLFSWVIWTLVELISFGIQIKNGAGAGAWVSLFSALIAFIVIIYAFQYKEINITRIDWICFVGALLALVFWLGFHNPVLASVFLILTDLLAFIPTFRKSWTMPHEETLFEYIMASLKFVVAFFAFNQFTLANVLYPAYLVVANIVFVLFSLARRRAIK